MSADEVRVIRMLIHAGRPAEAEARARQSLVAAPDDPDLLIALADALSAQRRGVDAVVAAERAVAAAPQSAMAHGALGDAHLLGTRRWHHAIDAYSRAIALDPTVSGYFTGRAQATLHYVPDGRRAKRRPHDALRAARADAEYALHLDPRSALAHIAMAKVQLTAGEAFAARESAERALRIEPGNDIAHQVRGLALQSLGDVEGASAAFVAAARQNPRSDAPMTMLRNMKVSLPLGALGTVFLIRIVAGLGALVGLDGTASGVAALLVIAAVIGWYVLRHRSHRRRMVPEARAALAHDRSFRRSSRWGRLRR